MKALVVGFPKSGTTTIQTALEHTGLRSAHWRIPEGYIGQIMYENHFRGRPIFSGLDFDVVTQADVCLPAHGLNYWPQLDFAMLFRIRRDYPGCVFLLNWREPSKVARSISTWDNNLQQRITDSDIPGLPVGYGKSERELTDWIEAHYSALRSAFGSDGLVEFDIASAEAPVRLGEALGIEVSWWGTANKTESDAD